MKLVVQETSTINRGAALQYTPKCGPDCWHPVLYGRNVGELLAKYRFYLRRASWLKETDNLRIVADAADLGNARFWSYVNGGWVKITLRPGQKLHWACGGPNDEGVNVSYECWHFDDYDGCLYSSVANYGYDCDGRYSSESEFRSPLVDLRFHEIECDLGPADLDDKGQPIRTPNWDRVRASQRDYAAEAMGY